MTSHTATGHDLGAYHRATVAERRNGNVRRISGRRPQNAFVGRYGDDARSKVGIPLDLPAFLTVDVTKTV